MTSASGLLLASVATRFGSSNITAFQAASSAAANLAASSAGFVAAALQSSQTTVPDPSLLGQVGVVEAARDTFLTALVATLPQTLEPDVALTPYRHAAYMVHAYCLLLLDAVRNQQPVLIPFVVPTAMSLDQVLFTLYGPAAPSHRDEVLSLNHIATPLWIGQGTTLQVVAPAQ